LHADSFGGTSAIDLNGTIGASNAFGIALGSARWLVAVMGLMVSAQSS
jgi:hypothetical protein